MSAENNLSEQDKIGKLIKKEAEERKQRKEKIEKARERTAPDGKIPRDARARADRMRAEEKAADPEVALAQRKKQRKLIEEPDTVSLIDPYYPDEIHKTMFQKYSGDRNALFERERTYGRKSKSGWGRYGNLTKKKVSELMKRAIRRRSGAILPYTPEWVWEQILKDEEMGN